MKNKKLFWVWVVTAFLIPVLLICGTITKPHIFVAGTTIKAAEINSDFDTLYNEFNGEIESVNIKDGTIVNADITDLTIADGKIIGLDGSKITDATITGAKMAAGIINRGATLIVAASDSLSSAGADYVCDGTSDEVEIESAIADLPSGGGRVLLMEGTYNISDTIDFASYDYITLEGQGFSTILYLIDSADDDVIVANQYYNQIKNLVIDGNKDNQSTNKTGITLNPGSNFNVIENCYIKNIRGDGIRSLGADITIKDCFFYTITRHGITCENSENFIRNNYFYNIISYAINMTAGAGKSLINDNYIESGYSIYIASDNNLVTGNRLYSASSTALHADTTADTNCFAGNAIFNGGSMTNDGTNTDTTSVNFNF